MIHYLLIVYLVSLQLPLLKVDLAGAIQVTILLILASQDPLVHQVHRLRIAHNTFEPGLGTWSPKAHRLF